MTCRGLHSRTWRMCCVASCCHEFKLMLSCVQTSRSLLYHMPVAVVLLGVCCAASGYAPAQRGLSWLKLKRDYLEGLADSLDLVPIGAWHGQGRKVRGAGHFTRHCLHSAGCPHSLSVCGLHALCEGIVFIITMCLGASCCPGCMFFSLWVWGLYSRFLYSCLKHVCTAVCPAACTACCR